MPTRSGLIRPDIILSVVKAVGAEPNESNRPCSVTGENRISFCEAVTRIPRHFAATLLQTVSQGPRSFAR
jgi:hypothetical protein